MSTLDLDYLKATVKNGAIVHPVDVYHLIEQFQELKSQRDRLLEALKELLEATQWMACEEVEKARAIIDEIEGSKT